MVVVVVVVVAMIMVMGVRMIVIMHMTGSIGPHHVDYDDTVAV
jgi:hypothetical protein